MKETFWGYWLVLLGVLIIGVMLLVNNITTTNTEDYYSVKEVTHASMIDAMDFSYYRLYGNIKISEQKFVENFLRRFAENVNLSKTYDIGFYDLYEVPPKVSVKIATKTGSYNVGNTLNNQYDSVTTLSAILELGTTGEASEKEASDEDHDCKMYIQDKMMKYAKGITVQGYNISSDGCLNTFAGGQLYTGDNMDDFKTFFNDNVTIGGQRAKDILYKTPYKDLPACVKKWIQRGWIQIVS